ncbi:uncharacterized protein LOC120528546 [Polypterus senegalus]|uniref:uncharacterized protein LOC120528546 n=1 Tax=Polypterus senegalus TaxID=55291 RepID=UPI001966AFE5|nr:uncharacterized protein LOC120528546 [Polypterus senegalus]
MWITVAVLLKMLIFSYVNSENSYPLDTLTVERGHGARLQCVLGDLTIVTFVSWYRHLPNGGLSYVTHYTRYTSQVSRYTGEIHQENGTSVLIIDNVQRNDSATYVCIARSSSHYRAGSSCTLIVEDPQVPPRVFIFYSPDTTPGWMEPLSFVCLVKDSSPWWNLLTWRINGTETKRQEAGREGFIDVGGSYSFISHLSTVPNHDLKVTCEIHNNVTGHLVQEHYVHGFSNQGEQGCQSLLHFGIPGVSILILLFLTTACVCKRLNNGPSLKPDSPKCGAERSQGEHTLIQFIQNSAARVLTQTCSSQDITPNLLHI